MKEPNSVLAEKAASSPVPLPPIFLNLPARLILVGLLACFGWPLYHWLRFAWAAGLYSYTLLVPFVSGYLFWQNRKVVSEDTVGAEKSPAEWPIRAGHQPRATQSRAKPTQQVTQDAVAFTTLPFVLLLSGVCALALKPVDFRHAAFPLVFLLFMVPFPHALEHAIETLLQHGSAPPAYWLFNLAGTSVHREDMIFNLPGITIQIAPECSGIRSTLVLFITSLLAGHLFLRSPWKRAVVTLVVIPLALLRNGFRIFTIGQLCVSIGPHMIDSPIHNRGGPIFFALSLIPFFILVFFLVKTDRSQSKLKHPAS